MRRRILARPERSDAGQVERLKVGRDRVLAVELTRRQMEPDWVDRHRIARIVRGLHALRQIQIADDFVGVEANAPGLEQPRQRRRCRPGHRRIAAAARLRQFGIGIDEDERASARQHELVDGIVLRVAQRARLHDHQHIGVSRDALEIGREHFSVVGLRKLLVDRIGSRCALHRGRAAVHRQSR